MTDVNDLYRQYQSSRNCVDTWEKDVNASKGIIKDAKTRLGGLEQNLKTAEGVRDEKETALAEAISTQINEQRATLTRANRMLKKGNVENAYLVLTGQEPEENAENQPVQLVQVASPEVAIRMATGRLYGVDRESGESLWKYETPGCLPVFAQDKDRVFVADYKTLVSLDRKSGREISRERIADRYLDALLQDEGVLFVASEDDVSAYDVNSLQKIWEERIPDNLALAKSGENLFACGYRGLFAIDPKTGKVKWDNSGKTYHIAGGANNEGSVYTANCWRGEIRKLDRDGQQIWENRDDIPVAVMKANNGILYVASKFGQVSALDSETGKQMWRSERIGDYAFPWQIGEAQDRLEVTVTEPYYARESKVISLNPKTGKQI